MSRVRVIFPTIATERRVSRRGAGRPRRLRGSVPSVQIARWPCRRPWPAVPGEPGDGCQRRRAASDCAASGRPVAQGGDVGSGARAPHGCWPAARWAARHRRPGAGPRWCRPGRPRPVRAAGRRRPARSSSSSWTAVPTVAPTTSPTLPSSPARAAAAFSAAADVTMLSATLVSRSRACCTLRPSGLEVSARTKTPRPRLGGQVQRRPQRLEPEVGADGERVAGRDGVLAEVGLGVGRHRRADVAALGVEDDQRAGLAQRQDRRAPGRPPRASRRPRRTPTAASRPRRDRRTPRRRRR